MLARPATDARIGWIRLSCSRWRCGCCGGFAESAGRASCRPQGDEGREPLRRVGRRSVHRLQYFFFGLSKLGYGKLDLSLDPSLELQFRSELTERVLDCTNKRPLPTQVGAKVANEVQVVVLTQGGVAGALPLVPGALLRSSRDA